MNKYREPQFTAGVTIEDGRIVARCSCGWYSSTNPFAHLVDSRVAALVGFKFVDCLRHQREQHADTSEEAPQSPENLHLEISETLHP